MATAPFQMLIDGPSIVTAVRVSSTVTITTAAYHGLSTGSYVQMDGFAGTIGSSINGCYQVTNTSGTTFTFTAAGTAGTAVTSTSRTTEYFAHDVLNPLINYSGTAKHTALYVPMQTIATSFSGDGDVATMSFTVVQDDTPDSGPWWLAIPDQTRIRLCKANTGSVPAAGETIFRGFVQGINAQMTGSGQGSIADIFCNDVNALLDRVVIFGTIK